MRRALILAVAAAIAVSSCGSLNFIRRRLPPPTVTSSGIVFRFYSPSAKIVQLAGNWPENNWLAGQAQTQGYLVGEMKDPEADGIWERTERLPPGRYQYKFVIDRVNWKEDPNNPQKTNDGFGGFNSLLDVR
jgi:1,4-alpha-glucan branching enzyme